MDTESYKILEKEFILNYTVLYWKLRIIGFARFDIKENKVVKLLLSTLVYRVIILLIVDLIVGYLVYTSILSRNYLKIPDGICLVHFSLYANSLLINLTYLNRKSGLLIIEQSFKIDSHLGLHESKFMRDVEVKTFTGMSFVIAFANVTGCVLLYMAYYNVSMTIHIIGSLFFFWLIFSYDDYCVHLLYSTSIALRARYLNVALAKLGGVNLEYITDRSVTNVLFWKKPYNELVTFQSRASFEDYIIAFEMIFDMFHLLERLFQFPLTLGFWTNVVGTFVTSQTFIERIKDPNALENGRTYIIIGWAVLTWTFMILISLFIDLFQQQIEQTKLICAFIQLKPNRSAEIYKLTKTVLRFLERRKTSVSVSQLFFFDTGFILTMAAATLVYITVQLQLAFPDLPNPKINVTSSE